MAGDLFDINIIDNDVSEALNKLYLLLAPAGMMFFLHSTMGPYLRGRARDRFAKEGDDAVGKWQPLAPSTVTIREESGFGGPHPINRRTGELENWVVDGGWNSYPTGFGASLQYPKRRPSGELAKKVTVAQKGQKLKPVTPARPVLGVGETDIIFFQAALAFAVGEAIK